MSYYSLTEQAYRPVSAASPGHRYAPVPGWGINPLRAGPPRIGVGSFASGVEQSLPIITFAIGMVAGAYLWSGSYEP